MPWVINGHMMHYFILGKNKPLCGEKLINLTHDGLPEQCIICSMAKTKRDNILSFLGAHPGEHSEFLIGLVDEFVRKI